MLSALLVLGVLFAATYFTRTPPPPAAAGPAYDGLARGVAEQLRQGTVDTSGCPGGSLTAAPESWLDAIMQGNACTSAAVDAAVQQVMPAGMGYLVRIENGVGSYPVLPYGTAPNLTPQGAATAALHVAPAWPTTPASPTLVHPGGAISSTTWACLRGPTGSTTGPHGASWLTLWTASGTATAPAWVPYGHYTPYSNAGCTTALPAFQVIAADTAPTMAPTYTLAVVVWNDA